MVSEKSVFFFIFLIPDFTFAIVSFHVSNRFVEGIKTSHFIW